MEIKKVDNINDANICDNLLTKLILDEANYNDNINKDFKVNNWFSNLYNKENSVLYVAKVNDLIVGYIYIKIISDSSINNSKEALIDGLYVNEEYRNQGIASKLIEEVLNWCRNNEIKYIDINVLCSNETAIHLYKKYGFNEAYVMLKKKI